MAAAARDLILLNLVVLVKNWRGPGTISRIIQFEVSINQSLNQICYCCEKNSAFKPLCVKPKNRPCIRAKTEVGRKIALAAAARDLILLNLVVLVKNWRGPGTISRIFSSR